MCTEQGAHNTHEELWHIFTEEDTKIQVGAIEKQTRLSLMQKHPLIIL